ncbi:MAG: serine/threonine protein kinase, bacterial, partial [Actinomycetota bacterium]|nr:serine/threonine protein kinase, bacterial [Actinomycetota bacterium]
MTRVRDAIPGYVLEHRLGEGAASTVWRARQSASMDRPVAIKRGAQLEREAKVLAALDHPNIVRVFEVVPDGDGVAVVMQLAPGGSLEERLTAKGPRPLGEVVDVVTKLAGALGSAHRRGVLHGDVKPGNVLFTADGEPLLADFGIGGLDDGRVRGTEGYLDPTVLAGRPPDASSDVYGLAAVARTMLGPDAPVPAAVERALSPVPADRFPSAEAFAEALAQPAPVRSTRTFGPRPPTPPPPAARPPRRLAAGAGGVGVVAAAAA